MFFTSAFTLDFSKDYKMREIISLNLTGVWKWQCCLQIVNMLSRRGTQKLILLNIQNICIDGPANGLIRNGLQVEHG